MKKNIVFMFSGQGSQYYHMGKELYCKNAVFRRWMSTLDDIVYKNVGLSITDEIYNKTKSKADNFDHLLYTHPAIFMVEYSLARVLIESGIEPDYVLGASLGEFTSAAVAGIISVEETIECLLKQAKLIESCCELGSMIAIIHNPELYYQVQEISLNSDLAAINYFSHFVISGNSKKLLKIEEYLINRNITFQTIPVRYGFHSSNIDSIENEYIKKIHKIFFKKPGIPIISSLLSGNAIEFSPKYFWDIARQPIYFEKTILKFEKIGQFNYIDLGPSGTLANFVKKILNKDSLSQIYDVLTPFGQDIKKFEKIKERMF
ncbi:acyltransferase domain-containing protein [Pelosinus baikalensis]|uniref:Acyltransferase domain-containing protein n=1 Tax=Pelosinus baikalensis TaxID=2892015 RepID=A0ABS8HV73_9FIRM|nr:acyltransferase domain-containing protein [Pelosinus baikalensis]MCC5467073.1 acyltransferase domain-containing protein [Pelosinus baikalensis]